MWRMWEHVNGLHGCDTIIGIHQLQVTGLCGRVAADIDNTFGGCIEDGSHYVGVHAGTWWVGDDDIRTSVLGNKVVGQDVLHVAGIEQRVLDAINLAVDFGVLDGFRHVLNTDDLTGFLRHEVGNGTSACIEVVDQRLDV